MQKKHLSNPKNSEFATQLKSIIGKSFNDDEVNNILEIKDQEFKNKIKDKFKEKREEREKFLGKDEAEQIEKRIFLQLIDQNWKSHIQYLEQLRGVIGLRSYGQRDPLIEYKKEAFSLFENLLNKLKTDFITILLNLVVVEQPQSISPSSKTFSSINEERSKNI